MNTKDQEKKVVLLWSLREAAEALGISERKLWGMTDSHEIPHVRLGRCLRYAVRELEQWIDENKKGGA
jgi:excisionase family DNA binding protein